VSLPRNRSRPTTRGFPVSPVCTLSPSEDVRARGVLLLCFVVCPAVSPVCPLLVPYPSLRREARSLLRSPPPFPGVAAPPTFFPPPGVRILFLPRSDLASPWTCLPSLSWSALFPSGGFSYRISGPLLVGVCFRPFFLTLLL